MQTLKTSLREARQAAGLSQQALAEMASVSRQAYAAVERGAAVPSTEVALRLARALGTSVERLFALADAERPAVLAEWADEPEPARAAQPVRLLRVGEHLWARPVRAGAGPAAGLAWADGIAHPAPDAPGRVRVELLGNLPTPERTLVMLGCDPAAGLVATALQQRGVELVCGQEGSEAALAALARGQAHVAGCHLFDASSGRYNTPWVARLVPFPCTVVGFAVWEQGLIVAPGNPLQLRAIADLARPGVRLVNRPSGTGARLVLDTALEQAGIPPGTVAGYDRLAGGHLAVAETVHGGLADAGVGVRAAALAYDLDFVPLGEERYDLVIPDHFLDLPAVAALLDALRRPALQQQVELLGGYDVSPMGSPSSVA
ncbi:MAG TPA: substrate-binding domain-containing protein [Chloroflexota bacterium]|jgi:molybdate-binding protein/DNA-binding XRE family transcriptional regulator